MTAMAGLSAIFVRMARSRIASLVHRGHSGAYVSRLAVALACTLLCTNAHAQLEAGDPADGFELARWASDMREATDIAFLSDGRAIVTRKTGEIAVLHHDGAVQQATAARVEVDSGSEKGLLGVVVDAEDNAYFFASTGDTDADKHGVFRGQVADDGEVDIDLDNNLIGPGLEGPANHDGGGMVIYRGQLYVGVGDTGANASPPVNRYGNCLNKPNAKILRINLDGSIPADNPLVGLTEVTGCRDRRADYELLPPDERIYAWGLRNPWRFDIDPVTGLLWIGDVGEVTEEEITVGGKGAHHGWPFFEGTVEFGALGGVADCMQTQPPTPCTPPVHAYPRSDGVSVTGGVIPTAGCGWGDYEGRYFFADWGSHRVWTIDLNADRTGAMPMSRRQFARSERLVSFRMGPDGAMYWVSFSGNIERLAPKEIPGACSGTFPQAAAPPDGTGEAGCGCRLARAQTERTGSAGSLLALLALAILAYRHRGPGKRL